MLKMQFTDHRQPAIWLVDPRLTIGADSRNHITLSEHGISPFHAEIINEDQQTYILDSGSIGGTYVNGNRISQRYQLRSGDVIKVAGVELQIMDSNAQQETASTASAPSKSEWKLQGMGGALNGKIFPIEGLMVIGRSDQCDICFKDELLSRKHAELLQRDNTLRLRDLDSANGTNVNHKRIEECFLQPGDQINFDNCNFLVIGPRDAGDGEEDDEEVTVFKSKPATPQTQRSRALPSEQQARVEVPEDEPETMEEPVQPADLAVESKASAIWVWAGVIGVLILSCVGLFLVIS